jgi:ubiquinone/menaquinone biosynthesis C-methylase UbiE
MSTNKKSRDWYEKNAEGYAEHTRDVNKSAYHSYYEKPAMYNLLPDLNGKDVLSIGCGSGEDSIYLKKTGARKSVGIDLSSGLIEIAKTSYPECEFVQMDMEHLDFSNETFDFVYSSLAIHYIENWVNVFKEVYKVLKPNSYFLFSCHHPARFAMEASETPTHHILKLEIIKNKETRERTVVGDYLSKRMVKDALGKDSVDTWSMSLNDISRDIKEAGFLIEQIVEPLPLEEFKEIDIGTYNRLQKIPEFIIFKLKKI